MQNFDFNQSAQDAVAQVQAAGQQLVEASQKTFAAQMALAQENTMAAFGLARTALDVRDMDGAKSFWGEVARASRETLDRSTRFVQDLASENVQVAQDMGKASKKR